MVGTEKRKPRKFKARKGFLKKRMMSDAIKDIPPVFWSKSPMILPLVITMAKREKTLPSPPVTASMVRTGSPASTPVRRDTKIRLRKGCSLNFAVRSRMATRAKRKIRTGCI
jgi:hypothetical protein